MTSSYLEDKISDMKARLKAENGSFGNDFSSSEGNNFGGSRPGSGRRPKLTLDGALTPTRTRRHVDLPGSNFSQPINNGIDTSLLDQKMKEIMKMTGIISINGEKYKTDIDDLEQLGELGNGTCGHVVKMLHKPSQKVIAVKQMRRSGNAEENKRIAMDLEVVLVSHGCDYIVQCLGCFITESDVWICMELMGSCFDKLIKRVVTHVPEPILGKVTVATVKALHYLKETHGVMHRDVKPSNILIDEKGNVKLCDFGISGRLVDSKAKSMNAGCAAYMSPERINPADPKKPDYDIRADVWSLGITLVELATGIFPYPDCKSDFEVLSRVMQDDPPSLPDNGQYSKELINFVQLCLVKDYRQRPKYKKLLEHPFIKRYESERVDVAAWYSCSVASQLKQTSSGNKSDYKCFCGFNHEYRKDSQLDNRSGSSRQVNKAAQDWEKLKTVWNNILKSPLFNRRKKHEKEREDSKNTARQEDEPSRPPVSPLLLQRFLHQQIQHINSVRPFRSPSSSPKCSSVHHSEGFRYDDTWLAQREARVASSSPPQHFKRLEQLGRHSSRKYRVSPSADWLVRSKSMADRSDDRPYVIKRLENQVCASHHQSTEEQFQLEIDELNRKMEDDRIWRLKDKDSEEPGTPAISKKISLLHQLTSHTQNCKPNNRPENLLAHSSSNWLDEPSSLEDRLHYRVHSLGSSSHDHRNRNTTRSKRFSSSNQEYLENDVSQRVLNLLNLRNDNSTKKPDDSKEEAPGWRADERFTRPPNTSVFGTSPEPPPRINKRVSPLLARRIAFNNSRMNRSQQSPALPRRYPMAYQYSNQNDTQSNLRSSSLPCSPILSSRNYNVYEVRNNSHFNDFSP